MKDEPLTFEEALQCFCQMTGLNPVSGFANSLRAAHAAEVEAASRREK